MGWVRMENGEDGKLKKWKVEKLEDGLVGKLRVKEKLVGKKGN